MLPDRHKVIPPGHLMVTGYVDVFDCELACRDRMAVGDVDRAYQKCLQLGTDSIWPCPNGHWVIDSGKRVFVIEDGRHEYIAQVMLGRKFILVAWMQKQEGTA